MTSYFKEGIKYIWPYKSKLTTLVGHLVNDDKPILNPTYTPTIQPIIKFLGPWESSMVTLQSILIWEKPLNSALTLFIANLLYWYFALNNISFYFGANSIGLILFLYHHWVHIIRPEICISSANDQEDWTPIHPRVLSVPEVGRYVERCLNCFLEQSGRLVQLRKRHPGLFCICTTFWFIILGMVGQSLSGVKLTYILMMLLMCGPGFLIRIVPKSVYLQLNNAWSILTGKVGSCTSVENEMADFMPEEYSEDAQSALIIPLTSDTGNDDEHQVKQINTGTGSRFRNRKITNSARKSKKRNISGVSSFTSGLSESDFPSLGDISDSDEEYDLSLPTTIHENSTQQEIEFVNTHFDDSSTDEEEEQFTEGLSFRVTVDGRQVLVPPPTTTQTVVNQLIGSVAAEQAASLLATMGQQLVSAMNTTMALPQENPIIIYHEENEQFELISDDEL